jgi:hypothetical protein
MQYTGTGPSLQKKNVSRRLDEQEIARIAQKISGRNFCTDLKNEISPTEFSPAEVVPCPVRSHECGSRIFGKPDQTNSSWCPLCGPLARKKNAQQTTDNRQQQGMHFFSHHPPQPSEIARSCMCH